MFGRGGDGIRFSGRRRPVKRLRSAVSSTTTGETGEAEECHGTRSRNVDDESGLVARGTKTLVPSHEQLGSAEIKVTVESEAADEDSEASGGITDLAVEARGASVVPTGKVAGEGSIVATEVRVKSNSFESMGLL